MATKLKITASGQQLPSPISIKGTKELIWSSGTARSSNGTMTGKVIAEKTTLDVKWTNLTESQMAKIYDFCPKGFFSLSWYELSQTRSMNCYRSSIEYQEEQAGDEVIYTDVTCQFIEQ